jgi:hypothetical protein
MNIVIDLMAGADVVLAPEGYSLENWLAAWLDGKDLW